MNRNLMYDYLMGKGLFLKMIWRDTKKRTPKYHVAFTLNKDEDQVDCDLITDWGYIRHIDAFYLCKDEVVIEAKYSDMKVNIKYKSIEKFDVRVYYSE